MSGEEKKGGKMGQGGKDGGQKGVSGIGRKQLRCAGGGGQSNPTYQIGETELKKRNLGGGKGVGRGSTQAQNGGESFGMG